MIADSNLHQDIQGTKMIRITFLLCVIMQAAQHACASSEMRWSLFSRTKTCFHDYGHTLSLFENMHSIFRCCERCMEQTGCSAILYDPSSLRCRTNNGTADLANLPTGCDASYAELTQESDVSGDVIVDDDKAVVFENDLAGRRSTCYKLDTQNLGTTVSTATTTTTATTATTTTTSDDDGSLEVSCASSSDCVAQNSICGTNGTCICEVGYTQDHGSNACTPQSCANYSDTFEVDHNHALIGYNDDSLSSASLQDCKDACVSATSFVCRSFELSSSGSCRLSEENKLTVPSALTSISGTDLYFRNCQ